MIRSQNWVGDVSDPMYIMLRAFDFCLEQDRKLLESSEKKNDTDCRRLLPALWRIDYTGECANREINWGPLTNSPAKGAGDLGEAGTL